MILDRPRTLKPTPKFACYFKRNRVKKNLFIIKIEACSTYKIYFELLLQIHFFFQNSEKKLVGTPKTFISQISKRDQKGFTKV